MKKSFKLAVMGMAAVSLLALTGCGDSAKTGESGQSAGAEQQGKLLKKIKERGKLIVGTSTLSAVTDDRSAEKLISCTSSLTPSLSATFCTNSISRPITFLSPAVASTNT